MMFASDIETVFDLRKDCGDFGEGLCGDFCDDNTVLCRRAGSAFREFFNFGRAVSN